jgi:hypothetical protein
MYANGWAKNSTGANWLLVSVSQLAKTFCFGFNFFLLKSQNPIVLADFTKIHRPFGKALSPYCF